ncbi:helix-turn-helix transcriptional regulator [Streptomyces sp. NPDC004539]|uniref:helix-turn-helix domain-containing protein n=1 Tax=Streptomyces sp. NPDC004539 TaxID=3154280 RepID=UPI0033AB18BA
MTSNIHLRELGEFLKARRGELSPRCVGLPGSSRRRVPGLRRDEVAQQACISPGYYARLEQGRARPSAPVLHALVRVLHLTDAQRDRVFELADKEPARPRRSRAQTVRPVLQRLLDGLTSTPAVVLGRRLDVLAWNDLGAALVTDFSQIPEKHRNYVRILFTDPAMRTLHADWDSVARLCVAKLRVEADRCPQDAQLATLVGELSVRDDDFRTWWSSHKATAATRGTNALHHPIAGNLILDWYTLTAGAGSDQHLTVWTAESSSPSHDGLRLLASWAATNAST